LGYQNPYAEQQQALKTNYRMRRTLVILYFSLFAFYFSLAPTLAQQAITPPFLQNPNQRWVDSVFNSLSLPTNALHSSSW
jgi:hypothetical protein